MVRLPYADQLNTYFPSIPSFGLAHGATELCLRAAVRHYAEQHAMELDRQPSVRTLAKLVSQARGTS